ncbi:hypothetical protein WJX73_001992 [Symbiochloris irregularis]|uniref:Uncharacterized protein n=1 Tax=Symbiochloris irregularis TaxID=706552 RepID=A0AAW1NK20_9CHLO
MGTSLGLELADVFQKCGLDKFPQGDYRKSGSLLAQYDRSIGKSVLVLGVAEGTPGVLEVPAPLHSNLGLRQRYLYLQVKIPPKTAYAIQLVTQSKNGRPWFVTISSAFEAFQSKATGFHLPYQPRTEQWTVLAIDLAELLASGVASPFAELCRLELHASITVHACFVSNSALHSDVPAEVATLLSEVKRPKPAVMPGLAPTALPLPALELTHVHGFNGDNPHTLVWGMDSTCLIYACGVLVVILDLDLGDSTARSPKQRFLQGHAARVCALAASSVSPLVASAEEGPSSLIRLWDVPSGVCLSLLHGPEAGVWSLDICPSGNSLLAAPLTARHTSEVDVRVAKWPPYAQNHIVACGRDSVRILRVKDISLRPTAVHMTPTDGTPVIGDVYTCLAFDSSPEGSTAQRREFFVGSASGTMYQIDFDTRTVLRSVQLHMAPVASLAVHQQLFYSAAEDAHLRGWPLDFSHIALEACHDAPLSCVVVSRNGLHIAIGLENGCLGVMGTDEAHTYRTLVAAHSSAVRAVAVHPSLNEFCTIGADATIRVWDLLSHMQLCGFDSPEDSPCCVAYLPQHPQNHHIACGFASGHLRIFSVVQTDLIQDLQQHKVPVVGVAAAPDGSQIFSLGADGGICTYQAQPGTDQVQASDRLVPGAAVRHPCLAVSPDSALLATASSRGPTPQLPQKRALLLVFKCRSLAAVCQIGLEAAAIAALQFSPLPPEAKSHSCLWVATSEQSLICCDAAAGTLLRSIPQVHRLGCSALALDPAARFLASGGADCLLKLWAQPPQRLLRKSKHRGAGKVSTAFQSFIGHSDEIVALACCGDYIISAGDALMVWSMAPGLSGDHQHQSRWHSLSGSQDNAEIAIIPTLRPQTPALADSQPGYTQSLITAAEPRCALCPVHGSADDRVPESPLLPEEVPELELDQIVGLSGGHRPCAAWHAGSGRLVYACDNMLVSEHVSDHSQRCLTQTEGCIRLAVSPDSSWVLAAGTLLGGHPAVALWDVATGCSVATAPTDDVIQDLAWRDTPRSPPEFMTVSQGCLLQWVLRLDHLSQFVWPLPPPLDSADCTAVECDASAGVLLGITSGAVWHLPAFPVRSCLGPRPVLCCQHEGAAAVGHLQLLNSDLLAVCLADGTVALLSCKEGVWAITASFALDGQINHLRCGFDATTVVAASSASTIWHLDLQTGDKFALEAGLIVSLHRDDKLQAFSMGRHDKEVKLLGSHATKALAEMADDPSRHAAVHSSHEGAPQARALVCFASAAVALYTTPSSPGRMLVHDCSNGRSLHVLDLHSPVHSLSCSIGSPFAAAGLASGNLALVDWTSGARKDLEGGNGIIESASRRLATAVPGIGSAQAGVILCQATDSAKADSIVRKDSGASGRSGRQQASTSGRALRIYQDESEALFRELTNGPTPSAKHLSRVLQRVAYWCERVSWPGQRSLLEHHLVRYITNSLLISITELHDEDLVDVLATLGQLDKHSVSSEIHITLQAAHGSLSEQGCRSLSASSICKAFSAYANSAWLHHHQGRVPVQLVGAVKPHLSRLSPQQRYALAADMCWLRLNRTHRNMVQSLLAPPAGVVLEARDVARLVFAARSVGRMPEQLMQALARRLPEVVHELQPHDLATTLDAYFRSKALTPELLTLMSGALIGDANRLSERQLSRCMYIFAAAKHAPQLELLQEVEQMLITQPRRYSCRSLTTLMWALVRMRFQPKPRLLQVLAASIDHFERSDQLGGSDLTPRLLCSVVWCFGSWHYTPPNLQSLLRALESRLGGCNAHDLAQLMFGLGAMKEGGMQGLAFPASLLRSVEQQACSMTPSFQPQGLAQTVHSFGKLEHGADRLCTLAVAAAVAKDSGWKVRDLVDLLWGCARLKHALPPDSLQALESLTCQVLRGSGWTLSDASILAWSCAALPTRLPEVVHEVTRQLDANPTLLQDAQSVDLSNLLWAIAQIDVHASPSILQAFTARVRDLEAAKALAPRDRSTILWSYGKLRCYPGEALTNDLLAGPASATQLYEPVAMCNVMYACGALRHHPGPLAQAVQADMVQRPQAYDQRDWVRILWALGTLMELPLQLLDTLSAQIAEHKVLLDPSLISVGLWTIAVADQFLHPLYGQLMAALPHFHHSELDQAALQRVHYAHLLACSRGISILSDLPTALRIAAQKSSTTMSAAATSWPVGVVRSVSRTLAGMGFATRLRAITEDGHFSLHLLLEQKSDNGLPIAIELALQAW